MKNNFLRQSSLICMMVLLCLPLINLTVLNAQTNDSVLVVRPQRAELVQWKDYQSKRQLPRAVLKLDAGYGWRTAETSDQLSGALLEYVEHLKSGFAWNGSFDYFFRDMLGFRIAFYQYRASHSDMVLNSISGKKGDMYTKDQITYIGPALVFRLPFGHDLWVFDANVGLGYIGYREKMTFANEYINFNGASVGFQTGVGLEYKIIPHLGIGINMLVTSGLITEFHYDNNGVKSIQSLDIDEGEGLGQISLGIGLRYYFK